MNEIAGVNTTLFIFLRQKAAQCTQHLIDAGYYDPISEGPDARRIKEAVKPFLDAGTQTDLPDKKLDWIIRYDAIQAGSAFQGLGNGEIAALWYQIGQYGYRGKAHWYTGDIMLLDWYERIGPAEVQEDSAICAALANNLPRAEQLFGWIAQNRAVTGAELQQLEKERQYNAIWENLGPLVFTLSWLGGRWSEVSGLAEIGRQNIEKTRKAGYPKDNRTPQLLVDLGQRISAYFLNPSAENKELAVQALRLDGMHDRGDHQRFLMLRYLFALAARFPEISPYLESAFQAPLWSPSASRRGSAPTRGEIQAALDEILRQAARRRKYFIQVSSIDLHLRVGGYPAPQHQLGLCCQVMRDTLAAGGKITCQSPDPEEGWLEAVFPTTRI